MGAAIDSGAAMAIRRVRDLEFFLDQLAMLEWKTEDPGSATQHQGGLRETGADAGNALRAAQVRRNIVTFAPEAVRGVAAYVDGQKTATA